MTRVFSAQDLSILGLKYLSASELEQFASHCWRERRWKLTDVCFDSLKSVQLSEFDFALNWNPKAGRSIGLLGPNQRCISSNLLIIEVCKTAVNFTKWTVFDVWYVCKSRSGRFRTETTK